MRKTAATISVGIALAVAPINYVVASTDPYASLTHVERQELLLQLYARLTQLLQQIAALQAQTTPASVTQDTQMVFTVTPGPEVTHETPCDPEFCYSADM